MIHWFDRIENPANRMIGYEHYPGSHDITVNKNGIPNDPRSFAETSGIRIGTAAETTRGHGQMWFRHLAHKIVNILE